MPWIYRLRDAQCAESMQLSSRHIALLAYPQNPARHPYFMGRLWGALVETASSSLPTNRFKIIGIQDTYGR